ncbi:MAG: PIN domain-containing protein [Promethearchaeota archaeon]
MKSIKSIILDTTYILPLFGIEINLSKPFLEDLKKIWKNEIEDFKIYLPSICLIESMYKLLNEYNKKKNFEILERYYKIIPTILNLPIEIFYCELNPIISLNAAKIRHYGHKDFMDCWIAGTALFLNGILLSEDTQLKSIIKQIPEFKHLEIWSWDDLKKHKVLK